MGEFTMASIFRFVTEQHFHQQFLANLEAETQEELHLEDECSNSTSRVQVGVLHLITLAYCRWTIPEHLAQGQSSEILMKSSG